VYVVVDPAGEKKKSSDYTVMWVMGLGQDGNYYVIDGLRDKLGLKERADRLFRFVRDYRPKAVGYEKYGMQADIPYIQERMGNDNFNFNIVPLGGSTPKNDRIKRLQPLFQEHRIFLPETLVRGDYQGKPWDLTRQFVDDEYAQFPYMAHDDMLDCMARIIEPDLSTFFPLRVSVDENGKAMETWDTYSYNTFEQIEGNREATW
jgi:predicted phage terminase large subunit-like protein